MALLACMILSSVVGDAGVLWQFDFEELPSGWSADSLWEFPGDGAVLFLYASADSGYNWQSQMWSEELVIPSGVDSIWILLTDQHMNWGAVGGGYAWSSMGAEVYLDGIHSLSLWGQYNEWGKGYGPDAPQDHQVMGILPVDAGDVLDFGFHGEVHAQGGAFASIEYVIYGLVVSSSPIVSLESTTWAGIKSLLF